MVSSRSATAASTPASTSAVLRELALSEQLLKMEALVARSHRLRRMDRHYHTGPLEWSLSRPGLPLSPAGLRLSLIAPCVVVHVICLACGSEPTVTAKAGHSDGESKRPADAGTLPAAPDAGACGDPQQAEVFSTLGLPCAAARALPLCTPLLWQEVTGPDASLACEFTLSDSEVGRSGEDIAPARLFVWLSTGGQGRSIPELSDASECSEQSGFYVTERSTAPVAALCPELCGAGDLLLICQQ